MKNYKLVAAAGLAALLALSGAAFAHDMGKGGTEKDAPAHHHRHMCKNDKAKSCHKGMRDNFKKDHAAFEKMHTLQKKLHAALVAPKFDKKSFLALSGQMEQLRGQIERRHAEAFADMAAKMPQQKRERIAERFHEHHGHEDWHDHEEGGWQHHIEWSHGAHAGNNGTHDWDRPTN